MPKINYLNHGLLNLDLTSYDRLRINFDGMFPDLNFNILVFDEYGTWAQGGCNISYFIAGSFKVDFPLNKFARHDVVDWTHIHNIDVIFQAANPLGSPNLALTAFSAIPSSDPAGTISCHF